MLQFSVNHFLYLYIDRMKLAAMHFNENRTKKQATTKDGIERYSIHYPKSKKGEAVVAKPIKEAPTYGRYFVMLEMFLYGANNKEESTLQISSHQHYNLL